MEKEEFDKIVDIIDKSLENSKTNRFEPISDNKILEDDKSRN